MVLGCLALPSNVLAAPNDATATLAYLRADRALYREFVAHLPAAQVDGNSFVEQVTKECPAVMAQAPTGENINKLAEESLDAYGLAFTRPYAAAALVFARAVEHLHWRSRKLTRLVRLRAASDRAEATVAPPHLCSDLKEWVAGGYGTLPKTTTSFLRIMKGSSEEPAKGKTADTSQEEILVLLASHPAPHTKTLLRSVKRLELQTQLLLLKTFVKSALRMQEGLGFQLNTSGQGPL
jgi:hypothetical protein